MRTVEQQEKNIHTARAYAAYDVTQAIRNGGYGKEDTETMVRIINATYEKDALQIYEEADTAVREYLQDIIEETYYGTTTEQKKKQEEMMAWGAKALTDALEAGNTMAIQETWKRAKELGLKITFTR